MLPDLESIDLHFAACLMAEPRTDTSRVQEILQFRQPLACVLLDLRCLEEVMNRAEGGMVPAGILAPEELATLGRLSLVSRRREWLGGRLAAKHAAALLFAEAEFPQGTRRWQEYTILADENGRPFLSLGSRGTQFSMASISISHSGYFAAAMAVYKGCCGIDIQKITPQVIKVQTRFCSADEERVLREAFPGDTANTAGPLTKLWAAKEALRKAAFAHPLPGFLEMELAEIIRATPQDRTGFHGFILTKDSRSCRVAVTDRGDYVLALAARTIAAGCVCNK